VSVEHSHLVSGIGMKAGACPLPQDLCDVIV
jgi:hypothetical protein